MVKKKKQNRKQRRETKNGHKQITCIICPIGCTLDVECTKTELKSIHGHKCKSGKIYAKEEIFNPTRTVTTTIKVQNGFIPLVSVKTDKPVPKGLIFEIMDEVKQKSISAPVKIGDIIIENIKKTGVNIIATKTVDKNKMN
jgi:CxxC motif-containing protein